MLVVNAVLKWFKMHTQWLLILDNADDLTLVREFLPSAAEWSSSCSQHGLMQWGSWHVASK